MNSSRKMSQDLCRPKTQKRPSHFQTCYDSSNENSGNLIDLPFMEWEEDENEEKQKSLKRKQTTSSLRKKKK